MNSRLRVLLVPLLALAPAFCQNPAIKNWTADLSPMVDPVVKRILDSSGVSSASVAITRGKLEQYLVEPVQ
jgi:hypothetical protein